MMEVVGSLLGAAAHKALVVLHVFPDLVGWGCGRNVSRVAVVDAGASGRPRSFVPSTPKNPKLPTHTGGLLARYVGVPSGRRGRRAARQENVRSEAPVRGVGMARVLSYDVLVRCGGGCLQQQQGLSW